MIWWMFALHQANALAPTASVAARLTMCRARPSAVIAPQGVRALGA